MPYPTKHKNKTIKQNILLTLNILGENFVKNLKTFYQMKKDIKKNVDNTNKRLPVCFKYGKVGQY